MTSNFSFPRKRPARNRWILGILWVLVAPAAPNHLAQSTTRGRCNWQQLRYVALQQRWKLKGENKRNSWMFPKIMVPPNHPILIGFSIINHPFWGTTIFWKHPFKQHNKNSNCYTPQV